MSGRIDIVHPPRLQRLKAAWRKDVALAGGQDDAGEIVGRCQQRVSFWGLPNSDAFPPIDAVADVTEVIAGLPGGPNVIRTLCQLAGGVYVPLPAAGDDVAEGVHARLAESLREHSDAARAIVTGFADGRMGPDEIKTAIGEAREAAEAAVRLTAALESLREG